MFLDFRLNQPQPTSQPDQPIAPIMLQIGDPFLFQTICNACSQNPVVVKEAESKIQQLEVQPGYCLNLLVSVPCVLVTLC